MKHSPGTTRDIDEWARATAEARERRETVAGQVSGLIVSLDLQGSSSLSAQRVRAVVVADRGGDKLLLRAAVMEAAAAFGAWAAELDVQLGSDVLQ